ncbi:MAG: insulinase family protein [Chloroflexi bacterium]|nr:insulinase family protein [Chloroflexota bacterium]
MVIILKEVHTAPVISWWVLYRVGSRNEQAGETGISHWVEHMMFKGTPRFPAGSLDRAIDRAGGTWNAHTWLDHTAYHATLPADRIDLALEMEADRMVNASFEPAEVEAERTVIISERQGSENHPSFWLREEVQAAAFRVHPYHHQIIGDMADLRTLSRENLFQHYHRYYMPNNAIGVAVGDFDSDAMLARIRQYYGSLPAGKPISDIQAREPQQLEERRITVEREGNTSYVQIAYHVPAATHDDWICLSALDSILGGPSGPGGGEIGHRTSRLYKGLVETQLAAGVSCDLSMTVDPYLLKFTAVVRDGRNHAEVETAIDNEIARLQERLVADNELTRAKKQAHAAYAYSNETVTGQAYYLAYSENVGGYQLFLDYPQRLAAVTAEDIRTVARRYLQKEKRTVGWFVPIGPRPANS